MFHRGQKVVITESNAKGHTHPARGDMGYIDNMFLFPKERFILISIYMCSYKQNDVRSERKKFILDLGMNITTKNKIIAGVNKAFFLLLDSVLLNPLFFTANNHRLIEFPQLVGTFGIWTSYTSVTTKRSRVTDKLVTIPIGHIKPYKKIKSRCTVNIKELHAWTRSLLPSLSATIHLYPQHYIPVCNVGSNDIFSQSESIYNKLDMLFTVQDQYDNVRLWKINSKKFSKYLNHNSESFIASMLKLNILAHLSCKRLFRNLCNKYIKTRQFNNTLMIKKALKYNNLLNILNIKYCTDNNINILVSYYIAGGVYRALFNSSNTFELLQDIKEYLPNHWQLDDIVNKAYSIKSNINSGSAALNRLIDIIPNSIKEEDYKNLNTHIFDYININEPVITKTTFKNRPIEVCNH